MGQRQRNQSTLPAACSSRATNPWLPPLFLMPRVAAGRVVLSGRRQR
ncbi:hypothetical protein E2C01_024881 [Portunus trituberculatus]|uniref:Uncharacterized protein n=1 Tax=Portunus trituberculatus TaxID=210409 RepID=A0A5B7EEK0_PORTR|nr:hypothetical protein [Portunus trituberculatus]